MKTRVVFASLTLALALLTGCSTVESRVAHHRASFETWPPNVQQAISAGQIGIGFTMEQVRVALGDPDHVFSRVAQTGSFEVWSYADHRGRFSFGVGVGGGSYHRGSYTAGGVGISTGSRYPGERRRVIFDQTGRVSQIEEVRRG